MSFIYHWNDHCGIMGKLDILSYISQPKGTLHCRSCIFATLVSCLTTHRTSVHRHGYCSALLWKNTGLQIFNNKNVTVPFMFVQQRATYSQHHCPWLKGQKYVKTKTWHLCNCWACQTKSMSIILKLPLFWDAFYDILDPVWDFLRAILSSSVSLFDLSVAQGLGFARSLAGDFKGSSLVSCYTPSVRVQVRLKLLPHLLHGVQLFVRFTCNQDISEMHWKNLIWSPLIHHKCWIYGPRTHNLNVLA